MWGELDEGEPPEILGPIGVGQLGAFEGFFDIGAPSAIGEVVIDLSEKQLNVRHGGNLLGETRKHGLPGSIGADGGACLSNEIDEFFEGKLL